MVSDIEASLLGEVLSLLEPFNKKGVTVTGETKLNSELEIDSVAAMDLIMEIEDHFEIDIPINLVSDVETVKDLALIVSQRREKTE